MSDENKIRSTTILSVRRDGKVVVAGDGQVTLGNTVDEGQRARRCAACTTARSSPGSPARPPTASRCSSGSRASSRRRAATCTRAAVELAKEWRTDRVLRRLEALLVVADAERTFLLTGTGDVIEPDDGVVAIGSGGPYALAAARALVEHHDARRARDRRARRCKIAGDICIYTNTNLTIEELYMAVRDPRSLTPRDIVEELDRYIVGQKAAKRAVAIALRNRWRRQQVAPELRDEIAPKNIIMIGPTGVGKTEIARRLAKLAAAPFLKVEASKFTEVGYVGRDVDSIVRDLVEIAVKLVKDEEQAKVRARAREAAEEGCSTCCCRGRRCAARRRAADPAAGVDGRAAAAAPTDGARARSCARCCAPASSTIARSRSTSPTRSTACSRSSRRRAWTRSASTWASCSRCSAGAARRRAAQAAQGEDPAGARAARPAKRPAS